MLNLLAHPGHHPHPHHESWLAVITDNPWTSVALVATGALAVGMLWRALAARRN